MVGFTKNIISYKDKQPNINDRAYINPYAIIIGDVIIHAGVSLWPGVIIRAFEEQVEIGRKSIILDNVFIDSRKKFPVHIGEEVMVSHQVTIHGCKIGSGAVIGKNSNIQEGAVIGENSVITDSAYVPSNTQIPPRSKFSGTLGKVIGQVTDGDIMQIKKKHAEIIKKSREYGNWFVAKNI